MRETYISVDIEASGPVPSTYSMLSLGACLIESPKTTFYVEFQPVNENAVPAAMKVVGRTFEEFHRDGKDPRVGMLAFRDWITVASAGGKPVFVGFNATFDWAFVNFYFQHYLKDNPFGFGGIDIKSYYMGITGCSWDDTRSSRIPASLKGPSPHTHNALDDAIEQGEMFRRMKDIRPARRKG